jgi:predicted amidohydrolase
VRSTERIFAEIYDREFSPINVGKAFDSLNLFTHQREMREFDLASRLHLISAGSKIHQLQLEMVADRMNLPEDDHLKIVTYATDGVMCDFNKPDARGDRYPFYLHRDPQRRASGFRVNGDAVVEDKYDQGKWIARNQAAIDKALNAGAHVVCLGEFDFPPIDDTCDIAISQALNKKHKDWIVERLNRHAKPALVFGGSSHVWDANGACSNIGHIFTCDAEVTGGGMKAREHVYEKRISAKSLGESVAQSSTPTLTYFGTSYARIAVLICVDAFDPGIVTSIMANSRDDNIDRVGIILVPSYNPSKQLVRSCQQLSYLANCIVVYVNAFEHANHDRGQVFLSGIPLKTWKSQLENVEKLLGQQVKPDARVYRDIPGIPDPAALLSLVQVGREISDDDKLDGPTLMLWKIPHAFTAMASDVLLRKYPMNRHRILASLAVNQPVV